MGTWIIALWVAVGSIYIASAIDRLAIAVVTESVVEEGTCLPETH